MMSASPAAARQHRSTATAELERHTRFDEAMGVLRDADSGAKTVPPSIPLQATCSELVPAAGQRSWETRPVQTHRWQVAPFIQPGDFRAQPAGGISRRERAPKA